MTGTLIRLAAFALAVAPAAVLTFYVWARRTHHIGGEFVVVSIGLGASVAVLAAGVETVAGWAVQQAIGNDHVQALVQAFVVVGLTEEAAKFLVLVFVVMRHEDCRTPLDVLCGAVLIGLGFAALENITYIVGETHWQRIAMLRAFTAVPGHAVLGILLGYFAALASIERDARRRYLTYGLATAAVFHGFYDWPVLALNDMTAPTAAAIAYWIVFILALSAGGLIAMGCLESSRIHRRSAPAAGTEPQPEAAIWRPPPQFWRIAGACLLAASVGAPVFGYAWRGGGWASVIVLVPVAILPAIFGLSLFRFATRLAKAH